MSRVQWVDRILELLKPYLTYQENILNKEVALICQNPNPKGNKCYSPFPTIFRDRLVWKKGRLILCKVGTYMVINRVIIPINGRKQMGHWGYILYKWSYKLTCNRLTGAPLLIGAGWSWEVCNFSHQAIIVGEPTELVILSANHYT